MPDTITPDKIPTYCRDRYRKVRDIGHGAQASVVLVHDVITNEDVVIKRVHLSGDSAEASKALREVEILQALGGHPHIVRYLHSFDEYEGVDGETRVLNIVMEYCSRGDLAQFVKERSESPKPRHLDVPSLERWTDQLLQGVGYLHEHGYLHRDLKAANVFITEADEVKLADFGISRCLGRSEAALTMVGTPYYMAPEVMNCDSQGYDSKSDVWSLGVILYQLIALKLPFPGNNIMAVANAVLDNRPEELPLYAPARLRNMVRRMMHTNPALRPSMDKLREMLHSPSPPRAPQQGKAKSGATPGVLKTTAGAGKDDDGTGDKQKRLASPRYRAPAVAAAPATKAKGGQRTGQRKEVVVVAAGGVGARGAPGGRVRVVGGDGHRNRSGGHAQPTAARDQQAGHGDAATPGSAVCRSRSAELPAQPQRQPAAVPQPQPLQVQGKGMGLRSASPGARRNTVPASAAAVVATAAGGGRGVQVHAAPSRAYLQRRKGSAPSAQADKEGRRGDTKALLRITTSPSPSAATRLQLRQQQQQQQQQQPPPQPQQQQPPPQPQSSPPGHEHPPPPSSPPQQQPQKQEDQTQPQPPQQIPCIDSCRLAELHDAFERDAMLQEERLRSAGLQPTPRLRRGSTSDGVSSKAPAEDAVKQNSPEAAKLAPSTPPAGHEPHSPPPEDIVPMTPLQQLVDFGVRNCTERVTEDMARDALQHAKGVLPDAMYALKRMAREEQARVSRGDARPQHAVGVSPKSHSARQPARVDLLVNAQGGDGQARTGSQPLPPPGAGRRAVQAGAAARAHNVEAARRSRTDTDACHPSPQQTPGGAQPRHSPRPRRPAVPAVPTAGPAAHRRSEAEPAPQRRKTQGRADAPADTPQRPQGRRPSGGNDFGRRNHQRRGHEAEDHAKGGDTKRKRAPPQAGGSAARRSGPWPSSSSPSALPKREDVSARTRNAVTSSKLDESTKSMGGSGGAKLRSQSVAEACKEWAKNQSVADADRVREGCVLLPAPAPRSEQAEDPSSPPPPPDTVVRLPRRRTTDQHPPPRGEIPEAADAGQAPRRQTSGARRSAAAAESIREGHRHRDPGGGSGSPQPGGDAGGEEDIDGSLGTSDAGRSLGHHSIDGASSMGSLSAEQVRALQAENERLRYIQHAHSNEQKRMQEEIQMLRSQLGRGEAASPAAPPPQAGDS
eukprot:Hpha_TRINITY_DN15587_c1_g18::TRINITY_DN15587_c1_g18_i1::g.108505::m.108505